MATNKIFAANKEFSENFQKALSTITKCVWQTVEHPDKGEVILIYSLPRLPVKTIDGSRQYILIAHMITEVVDDHKGNQRVHTREYIYKIADNAGGSLYEFHWHPEKIDRVTLEPRLLQQSEKAPFPAPHIHVHAKDSRFPSLHKNHIPSGRVAFEDVLQFIFEECDVQPNRLNWKDVLKQTKAKFEADSSWGVLSPNS